MTKLKLPKYVQHFTDRTGRARYYFRHKKFRVQLLGMPYSTQFMDSYSNAIKAWENKRNLANAIVTDAKIGSGTFDALIVSYYQSSEFKGLKFITQKTYRNLIEKKIRQHYGKDSVKELRREHIKAIMNKVAETPDVANRILRTFRLLMRHAIDINLRLDDPCAAIKKLKTASTGFQTWTEAEINKFYSYHIHGSRARLAIDLLLHTGQRRQDIVRMGRQHIQGNFLIIRQSKTGTEVSIPLTAEFKEVLAGIPKSQLTFITKENGMPLSPEGFTNWFRKCVKTAGLPLGLSPHGLRKSVCRRLAEAGCSDHEIMAISGHLNLKEVSTYTQAADRARLATSGMNKISNLSQ